MVKNSLFSFFELNKEQNGISLAPKIRLMSHGQPLSNEFFVAPSHPTSREKTKQYPKSPMPSPRDFGKSALKRLRTNGTVWPSEKTSISLLLLFIGLSNLSAQKSFFSSSSSSSLGSQHPLDPIINIRCQTRSLSKNV